MNRRHGDQLSRSRIAVLRAVPAWRRLTVASLGMLMLPLVMACGGHASKPAPAHQLTAWQQVMAMTGPNGEVSVEMARKAFALSFGGLPGVTVPSGPIGDMRSGTPSIEWVLHHWPELTVSQRVRVDQVLGLRLPTTAALGGGRGWPGAPAEDPDPADLLTCNGLKVPAKHSPTATVVEAVRILTKIRANLPALENFQPILILCDGQQPDEGGHYAGTTSLEDSTGQVTCRTELFPKAWRGGLDRITLAHEIMHCAVDKLTIRQPLKGNSAGAVDLPEWAEEGICEWGALDVVKPTNSGNSAYDSWTEWITQPAWSLRTRTEDAWGLFAHLQDVRGDVWKGIPAILAAGVKDGKTNGVAAYDTAMYVNHDLVLDTLPSSGLREHDRGPKTNGVGAWDITAFGYPGRYPPTETITVRNDTRNAVTVAAFSMRIAETVLFADVVMLSTTIGENVYGRFGPGVRDDYTLAEATTKTFCTVAKGCTCPDGTAPANFTYAPENNSWIAVTGGTQPASVTVEGMSLDSFCKDPKPPCHTKAQHRGGCDNPPVPSPGPIAACGATGGGGGKSVPLTPPGGADKCGDSSGDPHLSTFDGRHYDMQAVGEFTLAKSLDDGLEVQARTTPVPGSRVATVNSAIAANVAADRVAVYLGDPAPVVRLNGAVMTPDSHGTRLPHGGVLTRWDMGDNVSIGVHWPDGTEAGVIPVGRWGLVLEMRVVPARAGRLVGLLGDADGNPGNDLAVRDGARLRSTPPTYDDLYPRFADSWRVTQAGSLFDYAPGQSTATFTDHAFPARGEPAVPDPARAQDACRSAGVREPVLLADCVFDVGVTGQPEYAAATAQVQAFLRPAGTGATVSAGGTLADGAVAAGNIGATGQRDTYPLSLSGATVFRLDGLDDGGQSLTVDLVGPDGSAAPGFTVTRPYEYKALPSGRYQLVVSRPGAATGPYRFRLVTTKPRRVTAAIGDRVTGRLDVPGRVDLYPIQPPTSGPLRLADSQPCQQVTVALVEDAPAPRAYTPANLCSDIPLGSVEAGHRYLIAVWSDAADTADYRFRIATSG